MQRFVFPSAVIKEYLIWVSVCVVIAVLNWGADISEVTSPVEKGMLKTQTWMSNGVRMVREPVDLVWYWRRGLTRMANLEQRLSSVVVDKVRLTELEEEVVALRSLKRVVHNDGEMRVVSLILSQEANYINAGEVDGIIEGMMVIDDDSILVGKVSDVSRYTSRIEIPSDLDAQMAVEVVDRDASGVLVGTGGDVRLQELLQETEVQVGDIVVTSGVDGGYPKGLVVAQISGVEQITAAVTKSAAVELLADLEGMVGVY